MRLALALLLISNVCMADEVSGVVYDRMAHAVGTTEVRVVSASLVFVTTTDGAGRFRVRNLPTDTYWIEVAPGFRVMEPVPGVVARSPYHRGGVIPLPPRTYIKKRVRSCVGGMAPRTFAAPVRRGPVETTSTQQGIRIPSPGRLGG
jgi:hypothetical protein